MRAQKRVRVRGVPTRLPVTALQSASRKRRQTGRETHTRVVAPGVYAR
jgi:hypothetical protein